MSEAEHLLILGSRDLAGTLLHLHADALQRSGVSVVVYGASDDPAGAEAAALAVRGRLILGDGPEGVRAALAVVLMAMNHLGVSRESVIVASLGTPLELAARALGVKVVAPSAIDDLVALDSLRELWNDNQQV